LRLPCGSGVSFFLAMRLRVQLFSGSAWAAG
jgi:hypothetical protein